MDRSEDGAASGGGVAGLRFCCAAAAAWRAGGYIQVERKGKGKTGRGGDVWELGPVGGALTGGAHANSRV